SQTIQPTIPVASIADPSGKTVLPDTAKTNSSARRLPPTDAGDESPKLASDISQQPGSDVSEMLEASTLPRVIVSPSTRAKPDQPAPKAGAGDKHGNSVPQKWQIEFESFVVSSSPPRQAGSEPGKTVLSQTPRNDKLMPASVPSPSKGGEDSTVSPALQES